MNQFLDKYEHTVFPVVIIVAAAASWLVMVFGGAA